MIPLTRWMAGAIVVAAGVAGNPSAAPAAAPTGDDVWWEGEHPKESNFPATSSFAPVNDAERSHLSGGAWLTAEGGRLGQPALWVTYEVKVPKAGRYQFWTRKFWKHGPFKWRFDEQPWTECPYDCPLADNEELRRFLSANWVFLGDVPLAEGTHLLRIEGSEFQIEKPKEPPVPPPPEYQTKPVTDWCTLTLPKEIKAGQTVDVTVESHGISGRYHVLCGMSNRAGSDEYLGFLADAAPSPDVEGDSKHTFPFQIPHQASLQCIKFGIEYVPEGKKYGEQMKDKSVRSPLIPVDQASIHPPQNVSPMCFDCFVLTTEPFVPRGRLKPGEKYNRPPVEGWFAFEPDADLGGDALLDLRPLNQKEAGADGWVQRKGKVLVFEKSGQPVRFWGVTAGPEDWNQSKNTVDYLARALAKRGVNLVRMHMGEFSYDQPNDELDRAQYFMAAMKKQGIYVDINFFCTACYKAKPRWNLPEFLPGYVPYTELFFYEPLQQRYKSWAKCLLGTPNPYANGVPMGKDPALASVEIIDESNYFWWAFRPYTNPSERFMPFLEKRFGDWLAKKYGSLDKLKEVWHEKPVRGDDFGNGRVGLYDSGTLGSRARSSDADQRYKDQVRFLTEDLRQFWAWMADYFHRDLGFGGCVVPSNWIGPEFRVIDPLDKYTYTAGDIVARNNYCGGRHLGDRAGYAISKGDRYEDLTTLLQPEQAAPMLALQQADYPFFWTEGTWCAPNRYRTEMPALVAAYSALQGIDGLMLFAVESNWLLMPTKNWPIQTPGIMGQFPAAALIYRNGYVKEGPAAIREALQLKDLYDFKGGMAQNSMGLDFVRAAEVPKDATALAERVKGYDPLTPLVGAVVRAVGEEPGPSAVLAGLPTLIDRANKTVTSATGEVKLDWGRGLFTIDAPCAQGAAGFLSKAGKAQLADVAIEGGNEFGTVLVVSMDGAPLKTSAKILVQVMSEEQSYGWKTSPVKEKLRVDGKDVDVDMLRIDDMGAPPMMVRSFAGTVTLRRPEAGALKVAALDVNGRKVKDLPGGAGETVMIALLPDCLYYIISK